ncbi:M20 family metallopeptidase [Chloroflexota bacterium]
MKTAVARVVDLNRSKLKRISLDIHSNPELGFKEIKAAAWLTQFLEQNEFHIERNYCELPTAFSASYGRGEPSIAFLAEYDALPNLGHGCGHNIIAACAVGAGIASKIAVDYCGGTVMVIGTPAEEVFGGKIKMIEKGAFKNLNVAMLVHPGQYNSAVFYTFAAQALEVEFFGRAAHAAATPEDGVNALEAMILSFANINSLRQHVYDNSRIHGIITNGGEMVNVVPSYSSASFLVRAGFDIYLDELKQKVLNCFLGASKASGARLKYKWGDIRYVTMRNNSALAELFSQNLQSLGRDVIWPDPSKLQGSTDMGNVSHLIPSIHAVIDIASADGSFHTPEFALAASSEAGIRSVVDGAKALAMTFVDLVTNNANLSEVRYEFQKDN